MDKKTNIAIIGVGDISGIYLKNITELFTQLNIVGVCDLVREKAQKAKDDYEIPTVYENMHEAFSDPQVDIILNLTRPCEHYEVTKAALEAGKHVYSEKPLGADFEEGKKLVALAIEKNLMIGGAPDTFLGAGIQTCRRLIDDGYIGTPVGAAAFMIGRGHEGWHPDPAFYYKRGGGPMLDMGPYYITALVNLLGRVKGVTGSTKSSFPQRTITSAPQRGRVIKVDVPTYVTGILDFENGAMGTIFTTFDVHYHEQARLEIYGSQGTLIVPDPNNFGGVIKLYRPEEGQYKDMPLLFDYAENSRGLGLADMAQALVKGRDARADLQQIFHVLEILTAFERSSESKGYLPIESDYTRRRPMENALLYGILE